MSAMQKSKKPPTYHILDYPNAIRQFCDVAEFGALKYARKDWERKSIPCEVLVGSMVRHLMKFQNGEHNDDESGQCHIAHVMVNAAILLEKLEKQNGNKDNS